MLDLEKKHDFVNLNLLNKTLTNDLLTEPRSNTCIKA